MNSNLLLISNIFSWKKIDLYFYNLVLEKKMINGGTSNAEFHAKTAQ